MEPVENNEQFRSFIAIDLPQDLQLKIENFVKDLKKNKSFKKVTCKWVPAENIHITVKFLGNITQEQFEKISTNLEYKLATFKEFSLTLNAFSPFPKERPRMLILDIEQNEIFLDMAKVIESEAAKHGIPKENRSFKPHITLVRIVTKPFPVIENVAFSPVNFKVTEIKLYKSESTEFGSKYTLLKTFPLQKNISSTICSE